VIRRSRVATEMMSEQETVLGQASSRAVLARTMTSKPSPGSERLMEESRSAVLKAVEEMRTEASQPLGKQSWKKRRITAAAVVGLVICLFVIVSRMMSRNLGHVFE
jgi:tetrahydromethanopterin S-methyltransferase subunit G